MASGISRSMTTMNVARRLGATRRVGLSPVVRSAEAFEQLHLPDQNVCLLRRPLPLEIEQALVGLSDIESFERKRVLASLADLAWLAEPLGPERVAALVPDLAHWLSTFRALCGEAPVAGSVVVTRQDDCRKYHVDWVGLRLIITYAGPGTEWVPNEGVHRKSLRTPWRNLASINRRIVPDTGAVMTANTGDVLILKGESYPGNSGRGAVHRSPPIAESNGVRLLFKLTLPGAGCQDPHCTTEHADHAR
jgi:Protein of unknown function (DUF1826)